MSTPVTPVDFEGNVLTDAISFSAMSVTIPSGQSLSPAADLGKAVLLGIVMPAAWDAAPLTLQVSGDGGVTFGDLYLDDGSVKTIQAAAGRVVQAYSDATLIWRQMKFRSGTPGAPVNQTAARTLQLVLGR